MDTENKLNIYHELTNPLGSFYKAKSQSAVDITAKVR